jgi:16S rRNA (guanine527-N7)-methyltransferase
VTHELHFLSDDEMQAALRLYAFNPTPEFCEKARIYVRLLLRWNQRVPLTTVTSTREILRFHFGESLLGIEVGQIEKGRLADVGSGAGFPGVPLAMALKQVHAMLIESNAKKAAFLSELRRELCLDNVQVHHGRAESVRATERFDIVTARAAGEYAELLTWSEGHLREDARVILWLGARQIEEVRTLEKWRWSEPAPIPQTRQRFVLSGSFCGSAK